MRTYRLIWLIVSIPLAVVGMSLGLILSPVGSAILFIAFAAAGVVMVRCVGTEAGKLLKRDRTRLAVSGALIAGTTASAFAGFVVLTGANALLLAVIVLGSSPPAVRAYARWLRSAPTPSAAQLDALARALAYSGPNYVPFVPSSELDALTDEQLCQAWRASYLALQQQLSADHRIATVAERQKYLDEFERRNPSGFLAWLASGARAPGNPLPYLVGTRYDKPSINWDELTRGQDR